MLEAQPIRSFRLDKVMQNEASGMYANRHAGNFQVPICFAAGTAIQTPRGEVPVEQLGIGDMVCTLDNGPKPIRWISGQYLGPAELAARPGACPILLPAGFQGARRPVLVSPQHAILIGQDWLVRARHLCDMPGSGVRAARGKRHVVYIHLLLDSHEILLADGLPAESLWPGPQAMATLHLSLRVALGGTPRGAQAFTTSAAGALGPYGLPARRYARWSDLEGVSGRRRPRARAAGG